MRRSRRLTVSERWEVGVFLALLVVAFLGAAAVLPLKRLPNMFAMMFDSGGTKARNVRDITLPPSLPRPAPTVHATVGDLSSPTGSGVGTGTSGMISESGNGILGALVPSLPDDMRPGEGTEGGGSGAGHSRLAKKPAAEIRWYKGQKYQYVKTLKLRVTAYAADPRCCWPYPGTTTASGASVKTNHGKLVAADTAVIPMYALVSVPGYGGGTPVPVLDRGGAIKGRRLDVLLPSFEQAQEWGTRVLEVKIYMPVE